MEQTSVCRNTFLAAFTEAGLQFDQAVAAYNAMNEVIADAVVLGRKVNFGKVGAIKPKKRPARTVKMPFVRDKDGVHKKQREFVIGQRMVFTFDLFPKFGRDHNLRT